MIETADASYWFSRLSLPDQRKYIRAHPGTHFTLQTAPQAATRAGAARRERPAPRRAAPARSAPPAGEKSPARVRSTAAHFKRNGVAGKATPEAVRVWNDTVAAHPDEYHTRLLEGTGLTPTSVVTGYPGAVGLTTTAHDAEGRPVMEAHRVFKRDKEGRVVVKHSDLEIRSRTDQGHGLAKRFLRNSMREYRRMGVHRITTQANVDVGGYAWAKYGFLPRDGEEWDAFRHDLKDRYARIKPHMSPASQRELERHLRSHDPRSLWHIADMSEPVTRPHGKRSTTQSVGKHMLLNTNWNGHLPLDNAEAMQRFDTYIGKGS